VSADLRIRILLAHEQSLFREAVRAVLTSQGDLLVVAEAGDGLQAVEEAQRTLPDIAFLDADLPNCDGLRAAALMRQRVPGCRIVVVAESEDQATLADALEAGAAGFLTKGSPLSELIHAARAIHGGETSIPGQMLGPLLSTLIRRRSDHKDALRTVSRLTPRERAVLAHLVEGAHNDAIAQALVISPETARTHVQNVLGKLGVHSRLEAVAFVTRNGIVHDLVDVRR
jgi:DNA-binding NarL/FixJ family response regulator